MLHATEPTASSIPETYFKHPAGEDSNCPLCRDGWPRWVAVRSGRAHHEVPEPAGTFSCTHGRSRLMHWAVIALMAALTLTILAHPLRVVIGRWLP